MCIRDRYIVPSYFAPELVTARDPESGEEVNFYQVIPLYEDELDYKREHDVDALLNRCV